MQRKLRVGAAMVVQNDSETIERSLASFYAKVERIVVSTDLKRGWSGESITPDDTIERIRAFDRDNKIEIIVGDYCKFSEPMKNDTYQRQLTCNRLNEISPNLDWIVQIDADEEFLNFDTVINRLSSLPPWTQSVSWRWIQLFNHLPDGRFLTIVHPNGIPILEQFAFAHRPDATLDACRFPKLPFSAFLPKSPRIRRWSRLEFIPRLDMNPGDAALHFSFAKSETRILEKLRTWSHSKDFDIERFFELWMRSKTDWESITDFHPVFPIAWPRLRAFSENELRTGVFEST